MDDLNDFFAKKDKKKCKGNKFTTVNDIDKKLEETDRKRERLNQKINDSEWKEFEERKKDYTGLKIQNTSHEEEEENINMPDEFVKNVDSSTCPWKVSTQEKSGDGLETAESFTCNNAIRNVGAYIPPHLRRKPEFALDSNKCITVPGVELSDDMFPTLQRAASVDTTSEFVQKQWENVKSKSTKKPTLQGTLYHLDNSNVSDLPLLNKYRTLSEQAE